MKQVLFLLGFLISFLLISCFRDKEKLLSYNHSRFYSCDDIAYYYTDNFGSCVLKNEEDITIITLQDTLLNELICNSDISMPFDSFTDLLSTKFTEIKLSIEDKTKIADLFAYNNENERPTTGFCVANYRDIFVFKKSEKIIGIAKICFSCNSSFFEGISKNGNSWNSHENFDSLLNITNHYRKYRAEK